jgi:uncharacterized cupin superfamily protein
MLTMNLFEPQWDAELKAEDGAVLRAVRLAGHAGAERLAANLYELEPGALVSPLHFHHANEELLFVLAGEPTLRRGNGEETLEPGAVVAFPVGPDGVHQIRNRSETPSRVLIVATAELPEVAEQPEAGRLAIITEDGLRIVPRGEPIQAP